MIVNTMPCVECGKTSMLTVDDEGYARWKGGELVQVAFPDLDADQRELLMSGTHAHCWERIHSLPCARCDGRVGFDDYVPLVVVDGRDVVDPVEGRPCCLRCSGFEDARDPAHYVGHEGHSWLIDVRYGSSGPVLSVYVDGVMKLADKRKNTIHTSGSDLFYSSLGDDSRLAKGEEEGWLEWLNNPWFDVYDDEGQHLDLVEHDAIAVIHRAIQALEEGTA